MKRKTVLAFVAVIALISVIVAGCAGPAPAPGSEPSSPAPSEPEYEIALASPGAGGQIEIHAYAHFIDLVSHRSKGRVEITYYGEGILGGYESNADDISAGNLQMCNAGTQSLIRLVPWASVCDLPFAWADFFANLLWAEEVFVPEMNKDLAKHNVRMLPHVGTDGIVGIISSAGPIHSPADVKGKVWRAMEPGVEIMSYEALGAQGSVVPWAELFTSHETGLIDMQSQPAYCMVDAAFYEVAGDFTVVNLKVFINPVLLSLKWWESLPEDIQTLIIDAWLDASSEWKWIAWKSDQEMLRMMQQPPYNVNVYFPTVDELAEFKSGMVPVYDWATQQYGSDKVDLMLDYAK